jgi:hypothetical protein
MSDAIRYTPVRVVSGGPLGAGTLTITGTSFDEAFLRVVHFDVDGVGGWIGVYGLGGGGQFRGDGVIAPGETKTWVYDLSATQIADKAGSHTVNYLAMLGTAGSHDVSCWLGFSGRNQGTVTATINYSGGPLQVQ